MSATCFLCCVVAVVPKANAPKRKDKAFEGLTIHAVERVEEAMALARQLA